MGTRINVLFSHTLTDWTCREESLQILSHTLPAVKAVAEYWSIQDPNCGSGPSSWISEPPFPPPETRDYFRYTGPGSFFVSITPRAVRVRTGGRWRGFLSIQDLRTVHLTAFRAIATAFDAKVYYCYADNDFVDDEFYDGQGVSNCIQFLHRQIGDPIKMEESIDPAIAEATEHGCPKLWYWDGVG